MEINERSYKKQRKKGILQELKNNHKLILPEEAKLVVKNCKTLGQMFKLLAHRFFIYEEGWSNQLNILTKNTFLPDNYEIGMYIIRLRTIYETTHSMISQFPENDIDSNKLGEILSTIFTIKDFIKIIDTRDDIINYSKTKKNRKTKKTKKGSIIKSL